MTPLVSVGRDDSRSIDLTALRHAISGLRGSLAELSIPEHAAVVLAVADPRQAAWLAAAAPACRATGFAAPGLGRKGAEQLLRRLRPALVIVSHFDSDIARAAADAGIALGRPGPAPGEICFLAPAGGGDSASWPERTAFLLRTTGTTGEPKLVALSRDNLAASVDAIIHSLGLGPEDRTVTLMPLTHIHGLVAGLHAPIAAGGMVAPIPPGDPDAFWRCLDEVRPTWLTMVPALLRDLIETAPARRPAALSALRLLRTASAPLPAALRRRAEDYFGVPLVEAYGMTEACHQIASLRPGEIVPGSVGRPGRGTRVVVIGQDGAEQPAGTVGELCVRGPSVISRFVWPEAVNETAFVDGWYRTGDLGRVGRDGLIWITGRVKEQINRGGETLSPKDIEDVLLAHPSVAEAAVFPLPHDRLGEEVAALCVLRRGETVDEAALIAFAAERLPFAEVPKTIFFAEALPRTESGKVSRMAIASAWKDRRSGTPGSENLVWRSRLRQAFAEILGLRDVDDHAGFFALGGTSLHALRLIARFEAEHGIALRPVDLLTHQSVAGLAHAIGSGPLSEAVVVPAPEIAPADDAIPASQVVTALHFVEQLWRHELRGHVLVLMRLGDGIAYARAVDAFRRVVMAQPALRYRTVMDDGGAVVLRALPEDRWPTLWEIAVPATGADIEADPASVPELHDFLERGQGWDGEPVRGAWISDSSGGSFLLFAVHQTVADGFARALLPALLEAALAGRDLPPHRPPADLMAWVRDHDPSKVVASRSEVSWLPQDGTGEPHRHVEVLEIPLAANAWSGVEALARTAAVSCFAIAWSTFALLLERLAGGPVPLWSALQRRRDTLDFATLGNVTSLARFVPKTADSFIDAAREAMGQFFEVMASGSGDVPDLDVPAYYFEFEDEEQRLREILPALTFGEHVAWSRELPERVPAWDLRFAVRPPVAEQPGQLRLVVDLASFSRARARSLLEAYASLLEAVLAAPHAPPGSFPVVGVFDRARNWPDAWPAAASAMASELEGGPAGMAELFTAIFRRWPGAPAIVWRDGAMSFLEIALAAEGLARTLRSLGIAPADVVAFRASNEVHPLSLALFIATHVATLRLGCPLLPLGQQLPALEARSQLETLDARFLIATAYCPAGTPAVDCAPEWAATAERREIAGFPGGFLLARRQPASPGPGGAALLLTSSGTTGTPKTIRLSQAMLLGVVRAIAATRLLPAVPGLLGQNIGFDAIITDIWMSWLFGQPVVALDTERRTPTALAAANALGAKIATLSPTTAAAALNDDPACFVGFEALMLIGEVVPPILVRRLAEHAPSLRVLNGYGPAENAVLATLADITGDTGADMPLGFALPGYRVLIVDPLGRPLPPHWPGEFAIASAAPALGYHDTEMTAARFGELPGEAPGPFFRSGDLGWTDEEGRVRFLGRNDRQVKLNGVRVEIDGVEHRIAEVEGVADVGVVLSEDAPRPRLIAVVRPQPEWRDRSGLAGRIQEHCLMGLPRAATPAEIVFVDTMPMGPTGKKSHVALLAMLAEAAKQNVPVTGSPPTAPHEPRSFEARLAALWGDLLPGNRTGIDPEADVFTLGATSLDALRMVERIERAFGVRYPDHQIFVHRTIRAQAARLREAKRVAYASRPSTGGPSLELHRVRPALGPGPSRGVVLGMPLRDGASHFLGVVAENALRDYDIWGFSFAARDLVEDGQWYECARAIVARLLSDDGPRPYAMIGFSMGGFLAWLVDRMLVAAGWDPTPVINIDGTALLTKFAGWTDLVAEDLLPGSIAPPARMLLVQRAPFGEFRNQRRLDAAWASQGTALEVVNCPTVRHLDLLSPRVIAAIRDGISAFIEAGIQDRDPWAVEVRLVSPGGTLFRLLDAREPPDPTDIQDFLRRLPPGPIDEDFRPGLLYLATATGDTDMALSLTARLATENPGDHTVFLAHVIQLAALGRHDEAIAVTEAWAARYRPEPEMRRLAARRLKWREVVGCMADQFRDSDTLSAPPTTNPRVA